ncbi:MAG: NUDIX hydrolase [Candidatus Paracaedibacter sp.]
MLAVRTVVSGKWDISSGKSENDETPDQTAVSETFEEK